MPVWSCTMTPTWTRRRAPPAAAGMSIAGHPSISGQPVNLQENVYDKFIEKCVRLVKDLKLGDPLNDSTDVGPLIDAGSAQSTVDWIAEAVSKGARVLSGGKLAGDKMVEPTVLVDTSEDMRVVCQEVFAPVVSIMKYRTIDDAIAAINDPHWGLQAGVFTSNLEVAFKAARKIDVGGVMINDAPTFRADHQPYGGRRQSGVGLEGVRFAIEELTQPKFICLNLPKLD